jgi:hypothetical protein
MKNEAAKETLDALIDSGIDFAACLPDSAFKELYEPLTRSPRSIMCRSPTKATA